MKLEALDHVGLAVSDVERSIEWYQRVLGLERAFEEAWGTYPAVLNTSEIAGAAGTAQYAQARTELQAQGIEFRESDHQVRLSIYVLDPDSHLVEISTYEVGEDIT